MYQRPKELRAENKAQKTKHEGQSTKIQEFPFVYLHSLRTIHFSLRHPHSRHSIAAR
jgi:hypothetical protein